MESEWEAAPPFTAASASCCTHISNLTLSTDVHGELASCVPQSMGIVRIKSRETMNFFATSKSAARYWPKIIYGVALVRITAWLILITFCVVCFEYSVVELNKIIRKSRPHFEGLTIDQTRDFLIVYLIFGVVYIFIDGKCFCRRMNEYDSFSMHASGSVELKNCFFKVRLSSMIRFLFKQFSGKLK